MIDFVIAFVQILGRLLEWSILLQVIMSYFKPSAGNRLYWFLVAVVSPLYRTIGRVIPPLGMLDIRPLVALILVQGVTSLLLSLLSSL